MRIKLSNGAVAPTRANPYDAGLDLRARTDFTIEPGRVTFHNTGVSFDLAGMFDPTRNSQIPMAGFVYQRSSFTKLNVTLANGTGIIDASYRGNIILAFRNHNIEQEVTIKAGDKIAQIIFMPVTIPRLDLYTGSDEEWLNTDRGDGGFGSSGR